jgi:L-serine dehydratase
MRAANDFAARLSATGVLDRVARVGCTLFGSLGATGIGHGTPDAIVVGLQGLEPETVEPAAVREAWGSWSEESRLDLAGTHPISFAKPDIQFAPFTRKPEHPNAMTLTALDSVGAVVAEETYFSVGGGFIERQGEPASASRSDYPFLFGSADALLAQCAEHDLSIAGLARRNEESRRSRDEVDAGLDAIWRAMDGCIEAGLHATGMLPGMLQVKRRAGDIRQQLDAGVGQSALPGDWLGAYALAVNEENASGGRVVTAPTNGAAGILPAVLKYWVDFVHEGGDPLPGTRAFLLTATALGSLFKANASISGAEGGCQAEVGSACAMAAGGLTAVMHGTPQQVENAAEIAMEHHLGLTCDPVGGLVQIPCIERNAIAASTAVTAARLAMRGDGSHYVSLDTVVETMRQTGIDMSTKYKETSEGGLAVNVVEC